MLCELCFNESNKAQVKSTKSLHQMQAYLANFTVYLEQQQLYSTYHFYRPANIKKFLGGSFPGQSCGGWEARRAAAWSPKGWDGDGILGEGQQAPYQPARGQSFFLVLATWKPLLNKVSTLNKYAPSGFWVGKQVTWVLYCNVGLTRFRHVNCQCFYLTQIHSKIYLSLYKGNTCIVQCIISQNTQTAKRLCKESS